MFSILPVDDVTVSAAENLYTKFSSNTNVSRNTKPIEKISLLSKTLQNSQAYNYIPATTPRRKWKTLQKPPNSRPLTARRESPRQINISKTSVILDSKIYDALVHNGYAKLALTLQKEFGEPWDSIKQLSSPILMEQLLEIYQLSKIKNLDTQKIMGFCLLVVSSFKSKFTINSDYDQTTELLAKLILMLDCQSNQVINLIDPQSIEKTKIGINVFADLHFQRIEDRLKMHVEDHDRSGIQNSKQAFAVKLSLEISRLLITQSGYFNTGLINSIKTKWLPANKTKLAYESHMASVLKSLSTSPELRTLLISIEAPSSLSSPANHLIRIALDMPRSQLVSNIEAKTAALMALLSHLRQGPVGSCFATYIAIEMLSTNLKRCLIDFRELFKESKLVRTVNGSKVEFPFLMKVSSSDINNQISIRRTGHIGDSLTQHVSQLIGIRAACKALGIIEIDKVIRQAIQALIPPFHSAGTFDITVKALLYQIVVQAAKMELRNSMDGIAVLLERAVLAFEGQTHNLVLRIWENAIANTAEARDCSLLKQSLVNSVTIPIKEKSNALLPSKENPHPFLVEITNILNQRIHLQYDPNIKYADTGVDGHSSEGAFVLFDRKNSSNQMFWKQINSPESFQQFIVSIMRQALLGENPSNLAPMSSTVKMEGIIQFVKSNYFLKHALETYSKENQSKSDLAAHLGAIQHAPWLDKTGDDPKEVLHIYLETKSKDFIEFTTNPKTAEGFLKEIVDIGKKINAQFAKAKQKISEDCRLPLLITGVHACSLLINHSSFKRAYEGNNDTAKWINDNIILPGKAISNSLITNETREKIITFLSNKIENGDSENFKNQIKLIQTVISVEKFRTNALLIANSLIKKENADAEKLSKELDAYIYSEALPKNLRETLQKLNVHFADTNWEKGVNETHFSFIFNPGSASIELWEVLENDNEIYALSSNKWIKDQSWVCIPEPQNA